MSEEHPSEDRQVERDSQLSAMFDGELTAAECELLARRLTRDEALRAQWSRFALIGAALRAERGVALSDRVAWRVQSTIAQEPSYGDSAAADLAAANSARPMTGSAAASPNSSSERWMRFVRPMAGAGIAAGVAAASIFWLQTQETDPVLTADVTPTQTIVLQPEAPVTVAATRPEPTPVSSGEPERYSTPVPSTRTSIASPARFANYVVAHSEVSGPLGRRMALLGIVGADSPAEEAEVANNGAKPPEVIQAVPVLELPVPMEDGSMRPDSPRRVSRHYLSRSNRARFVALTLLLGAGIALGAEPKEWLERMNRALTTLNYEGVFTHVRGTSAQTLRIIHRVRGREVSERLLSLDGSGREFIREGDELTCYLPDRRMVLVERRAPDGPLLGALPAIEDDTSKVYEIRGGERQRLLNRITRVVSLHPRDEYRYGYRLWIDEETSMPLKTQLCDQSGAVIEQILFSSIDLPKSIPDSKFKPQVDATAYLWLRPDGRVVSNAPPALWEAMRLPPGFRMTTRSSQALPGSKDPVEHLVFSDGVASVSVFVEPRKPDSKANEGPARVGSSSAFSTVVDDHQVTAIGEVPPTTVQFIATQVKASSKAAATRGLRIAPQPRNK